MRSLTLMLIATLLASLAATGTDLQEPLAPLGPLVGTSWLGRFVSTPAPPFDHEIEWTVTLDGHVVRWMKRIGDLGFTMETLFYWDSEAEAIAFTQLASNGIHSRGTVASEDGRIALVGHSIRSGALVAFRQTFAILPDDTLEDCYFSGGPDGWIPEHVIVYERRPAREAL